MDVIFTPLLLLLLLFYTYRLVAPDKLLQVLYKYISLNPSIYLLPPVILASLLGAFTVSTFTHDTNSISS